MKITTFNPLIVTKDAKDTIALFEALGFERHHNLDVSDDALELTSVRMKDANGFYVDVAEIPETKLPQDLTLIRLNVDNFEEAYDFLVSKGFKSAREGKTVDTKTNKSCMMRSPSGFAFDLCQHIKDN